MLSKGTFYQKFIRYTVMVIFSFTLFKKIKILAKNFHFYEYLEFIRQAEIRQLYSILSNRLAGIPQIKTGNNDYKFKFSIRQKTK